jgi:2-methylisocitrate lyase-like PEP mutase family enzyme
MNGIGGGGGRDGGGAALRAAMAHGMVRAAGVADALAARVAEDNGFRDALYVSGGAVARSLGLPDLGLVTASEAAVRVAEIRAVTRAALIVDADTGYGGPLACARAVIALERIGAAAVHIEDQADPKRCAEYGGVALADIEEAAARVRAGALARCGDLLIIARTDALPVAGLDEACARLEAYVAAGADAVFVEGVRTEADVERAARVAGRPLLLNAADLERAGIAPERAEALGCRLLIHPSDLQRAAIRAMTAVAAALWRDGTARSVASLLATDDEREAFVRRDAYAAFEARAYGRALEG